MRHLTNDDIRKNRDEAFIEMMVWMFALGECRKEIENCREALEILINAEDFDEDKPEHGIILEVFHKLQFLEVNIAP